MWNISLRLLSFLSSFLLFNDAINCQVYMMSVIDGWLSVGHWWNGTDRGTLEYWKKSLSQCYFVHHKSQMDWLNLT